MYKYALYGEMTNKLNLLTNVIFFNQSANYYRKVLSSTTNKYSGHIGASYMKHERTETLGAIPERRSPQQVALGIQGDGIEMFMRIKTGKEI